MRSNFYQTQFVPFLSVASKVQGVILPHLDYLHSLRKLTAVTRQSLRDVEGSLWLPWAAAQQISARQKVEQSIRYGLTGHWRTLQLIGFNSRIAKAVKARVSLLPASGIGLIFCRILDQPGAKLSLPG